ncbi:hypothetical protein [Chishuiella sp.]|nr:hypothetical protein [Chishuiella sp.]
MIVISKSVLVVGAPLPINVICCVPVDVKVPEAEKLIPFTVPVVIL